MLQRTTLLVFTLGCFAFAVPSMAQNQNPSQPGMGQRGSSGQTDMRNSGQADQQISQQLQEFAQDPKSAADKLFVLNAACGNQFEIALALVAQRIASNPQVKQVAQKIAEDHQKSQQQLYSIAQQLSVELPTDLPKEKQQIIAILTSLPVDQFEKLYITDMQADHAKDLIKYRAVAQMSQNDQVRRYAQQTLPALQHHNEEVQQAAMALGLPSGSEAIPAAGRMEPRGSGTDRNNEINRTGGNSSGDRGNNMNQGTGTGGRGQ